MPMFASSWVPGGRWNRKSSVRGDPTGLKKVEGWVGSGQRWGRCDVVVVGKVVGVGLM